MLNVSRQEVSTTGEVLSQDGLTSEGTLFIEDGSGVKSGLRLGVSLAECVDPTTETGIVNVRYGDRTYAKIRDLKIFTSAIASAQAALSDASSTSLVNLETAFQLLEDDVNSLAENFQSNISVEREQILELKVSQIDVKASIDNQGVEISTLKNKDTAIELLIAELDDKISELQDLIDAQDQEISDLKDRVTALE